MKELRLSETHESLGAHMESFEGWDMPIRYEGIIPEHLAVREKAGLFDISHMGEILVSGPGAGELLDLVTSSEASGIDVGSSRYSTALNERGGVKDDFFIYRTGGEEYMVVVNAANTDKIRDWFGEHSGDDCEVEDLTEEVSMLAIQGPESESILSEVTGFDVGRISRFGFERIEVAGVESMVSRSGYTGEDGFEIYVFESSGEASEVWEGLMDAGSEHGLVPCGLGARDSLRLEAGYPLYGHELSEDITPLEAGIGFVVDFDKEGFIGRRALLEQRKGGVSRTRIGLVMEEKGVPRQGCSIILDGEEVGGVTSGGYSPVLDKGVGMGCVSAEIGPGEEVEIEIRGGARGAVTGELPFYGG